MRKEQIISADSHFAIKDDMLFRHLAERYRQPILDIREAEEKAASARGRRLYDDAKWPAFGRAGEWDPHERLKDMDTDQVGAEVLYPSPAAGGPFYALPDGGRLAAFHAFNNAAIDFAGADQKRLFPVYLVPVADVREAVGEVQRLAAAGARALMLPLHPDDMGFKHYWDPSWDPLWEAAQETGIPLSLHLGANSHLLNLVRHDPTPNRGIFRSLVALDMGESVATWCMSGLLERFPRLKIILVEAGLGWIPYFLERMDTEVKRLRWGKDVLPEAPSFYWHRNMAATFEEDEFGVANRGIIGVDNLMWGSDYPHPDSTWPESRKVIDHHFKDVPEAEMLKMVGGNAMLVYGLN